jgi:hypothetical protein
MVNNMLESLVFSTDIFVGNKMSISLALGCQTNQWTYYSQRTRGQSAWRSAVKLMVIIFVKNKMPISLAHGFQTMDIIRKEQEVNQPGARLPNYWT